MGEEADVPGGMTLAAQTLLPLCCIGGWTDGCGGNGNTEKDSQSPGHKVVATLIKDVQVRQD